jgi:hypothetical protein
MHSLIVSQQNDLFILFENLVTRCIYLGTFVLFRKYKVDHNAGACTVCMFLRHSYVVFNSRSFNLQVFNTLGKCTQRTPTGVLERYT